MGRNKPAQSPGPLSIGRCSNRPRQLLHNNTSQTGGIPLLGKPGWTGALRGFLRRPQRVETFLVPLSGFRSGTKSVVFGRFELGLRPEIGPRASFSTIPPLLGSSTLLEEEVRGNPPPTVHTSFRLGPLTGWLLARAVLSLPFSEKTAKQTPLLANPLLYNSPHK
jgi:hypothetical protein